MADTEPVRPIETAPRDGTWFRAFGPNALNCKAHFLKAIGPSGFALHALFSEFGVLIEATSWLPFVG